MNQQSDEIEDILLQAPIRTSTQFIQKVLESATCSICNELMFQPFSSQCGHSFCYHCINSWLATAKNCPTCRHTITTMPTINVNLRSIVDGALESAVSLCPGLSDKFNLLRNGCSKPYNEDSESKQLFKGLFSGLATSVVDTSDGVARCSNCHWEAHGRVCLNCGVRFANGDDESDWDNSDEYDEDHDVTAGRGNWIYTGEDGEEEEEGSGGSSDENFIDRRNSNDIVSEEDDYDLPSETFSNAGETHLEDRRLGDALSAFRGEYDEDQDEEFESAGELSPRRSFSALESSGESDNSGEIRVGRRRE